MTRTSRTADKRESQTRRQGWVPSNKFDVPAPPEGYEYRLVRYTYSDGDDTRNVISKMRQGYEAVKPHEILNDLTDKFDTIEDGRFKGVVCFGDLMLMKIPVELLASREEHYKTKRERLQQSVQATLMRNNSEAMPIQTSNRTEVHKGRRVDFQEDGSLPDKDS